MEKLAENDLAYFYLCHVVIVVTAVTTISLPPVTIETNITKYAIDINKNYLKIPTRKNSNITT
jgi:hypothetical protein